MSACVSALAVDPDAMGTYESAWDFRSTHSPCFQCLSVTKGAEGVAAVWVAGLAAFRVAFVGV